ncbi:Rhodanese domain-containing protein [Bordetella sputigena]|uniref:rhodanese-like domain-containing protein n=1 Tax=Bordetella sputigena TaxID=1416810 RepID=UPI0039F0683F
MSASSPAPLQTRSGNEQPGSLVSARELRQLIAGASELALLDVRETGAFSARHIFYSISLPLSHMEQRAAALVPRKATPIVLVDSGDGQGLAERAAALLRACGYTDVKLLQDGLLGWEREGYQFFSGVFVPNKAFGEYIEHLYGTPCIDAAELQQWQRDGKDHIILDSRPYEEFQQFSVPGGVSCPGAELVYRAFSMTQRPGTTIVINCAGRTRGIIGAQSLINAGIPNPVVTLKNGTAGWYLNGGKLREDARDVAPPPTADGLARAIAASERVAKRFGVREIDAAELDRLRKDQDRTLFLLDVRTPDEYAAGHLPGSRSAPGGQLIQSTEHYAGVLRARLVLVDDNRVRARMTASWLVQMGWKEVYVLADGLNATPCLERGPEHVAPLRDRPREDNEIGVAEAYEIWRSDGAVILDFGNSLSYRRGHIPGAWFAVRSRIRASLPGVSEGRRIIVTSDDGSLACYAAQDLRAVGAAEVYVLRGGTAAWKQAGLTLEQGFAHMADDNDDVWYGPYDFDDLAGAMKAYLSWEVGLVAQLEKENAAFLPMQG